LHDQSKETEPASLHPFTSPSNQPQECCIHTADSTVMSAHSANRLKEAWKATFRKLSPQATSEHPRPSKRCNNSHHPTDVEDGYFSDSIICLLHTRGARRSEIDLQRGSQQVIGLQRGPRPTNDLPQDSAILIEEAEVGRMEEISLKEILCQGPGPKPIGSMIYRLVTNKVAKHIKRGSKMVIASTNDASTPRSPSL